MENLSWTYIILHSLGIFVFILDYPYIHRINLRLQMWSFIRIGIANSVM